MSNAPNHAAAAVRASRAPYDAIVIGAGLNGLTAAAYLAKGGARVLVLERRGTVGGSTTTEEFAPGFRADTCRHDAGWLSPKLVGELQLARHGLKLASHAAQMVAPGANGELLSFGSHGPDVESLRRLSAHDAAAWPAFAARVEALCGFLLQMYQGPVPSPDTTTRSDLVTAARLGLKFRGLGKANMVALLRVLPMSVAELLDDEFETPVLKGALATRGVMHLCQGPRAAATAFNFLHHQIGGAAGALCRQIIPIGGLGALAQAVADAARAAGAEVRLNAPVAHVLIRQGEARGVVLESGEEIAAKQVVSGASPRQTFLDLCDPTQLAPEFVRAVGNIRYRGAWAKVNIALDRAPAIPHAEASASGATRGIVIAPEMDYLERAYDDAKYGRASKAPWLEAIVPTEIDPSLAPTGKHVMTVHVQYAPYRLRDAEWNSATRDALGDLVVSTLDRHVPGLGGTVLHRRVLTPADLEQTYALPEGHAYDGEMMLDQVMFMRPVPECSHYCTPVRGLYVCGSGAHPGGAVAGAVGANAARVILSDRKG